MSQKRNLVIQFFTHADNILSEKNTRPSEKPKEVIGYISRTGKLVFPKAIHADLPFQLDSGQVLVGTQEGKRTLKKLYIIPADDKQDGFTSEVTPRGFVLDLANVLANAGITYSTRKYNLYIQPYSYENRTGMEISIKEMAPLNEEKKEYTGKKRGPKPKAALVEKIK